MAATSSTPLLPLSSNEARDHPIQLRICHSSWKFLPQNALVYVRGFILAYLTVAAITIVYEKLHLPSHFSNWHILFDFAVISFGVLFIYHLIAFAWTFTHLYYPNIEDWKTGWEYLILRLGSLPSNMQSGRSQFYTSVYFVAAQCFPTLNATYFWLEKWDWILHALPELPAPPTINATMMGNAASLPAQLMLATGPPISDFFGDDWFHNFYRFNLYVLAPFLGLVEVLILSSVRKPVRTLGLHAAGLALVTALYLGWASVGVVLTGWYPFRWLNAHEVGSREAVFLYTVGFVLLSIFTSLVVEALLAIRESLQNLVKQHRIQAAIDDAAAAALVED